MTRIRLAWRGDIPVNGMEFAARRATIRSAEILVMVSASGLVATALAPADLSTRARVQQDPRAGQRAARTPVRLAPDEPGAFAGDIEPEDDPHGGGLAGSLAPTRSASAEVSQNSHPTC